MKIQYKTTSYQISKMFIVSCITFLAFACTKKFETNNLENTLFKEGIAIPLANAELTANDIFSLAFTNSSIVHISGDDGTITFSLKDTLLSMGLGDFINIPDIRDSVSVPYNTFNLEREFSTSMDMHFTSPSMHIREAVISYTLKIKSLNFPEPMNFILNTLQVNSNNGNKTIDFIIDGNQEIQLSYTRETFSPVDNKITLDLLAKPSRQTGVYPDITGDLIAEMTDLKIHSVTGVFNQATVELEGSSLHEGFNNLEQVSANVPVLNLIFTNDLPIQGFFDLNINGISSDGNELELTHPELTVRASPAGTIVDTIFINEDNSNIADVINLPVNSLAYSGAVTGTTTDSSEITIDENDSVSVAYLLEYPSKLEFSNFIESDSLYVLQSDRVRNLEKATIGLEVLNGLPLKTELIIFLFDEYNTLTDSILFPPIKAAPFDEQGEVISKELNYIDKELSSSQLTNFKNTEIITMKAIMSSSGYNVALKADYSFDVKIALKGKR